MNARTRWTRIGMRFAIATAVVTVLPFSAAVASAAGLTAGFDPPAPGSPPGTTGGFRATITDLKPDDLCVIRYGTSQGWNQNPTGSGNGPTVSFGPQDVESQGYTGVWIHCTHKDGSLVFPDYTATWDPKTHANYSSQGGPPAAAAPAPAPAPPSPVAAPVTNPALGNHWDFVDTGGDQTGNPWIGTWDRQPDNTWTWSETRLGVKVGGTATIDSYDPATGNIKMTRTLVGGKTAQTCTYYGRASGGTGVVAQISGTVDCTNSGIANMPWYTTGVR